MLLNHQNRLHPVSEFILDLGPVALPRPTSAMFSSTKVQYSRQGIFFSSTLTLRWFVPCVHTLVFETVSLINMKLAQKLGWLVREPQEGTYLHSPSTGITSTCSTPSFTYLGWGNWPQVLLLVRQAPYQLSYHPSTFNFLSLGITGSSQPNVFP